MSIDEQIALLESEKRSILERYEEQLDVLWQQKRQSEDMNDEVELPGGRRVTQAKGKPASQIIIDDRGPY